MQLISVNTGQKQPIEYAHKSGVTGIFKQPAAGQVEVTPLGLAGDAVVDKKHHGGHDQAVYVYTTPDYDWWAGELGRELLPGTFGENLTLSGIESAALSVGDIVRVGEVVLQVTAPRIPCSTLAARMGDTGFVKQYRQAGRPGFYCRVLQPGFVQSGDPVSVEPYNQPTVTIGEFYEISFLSARGEATLRRYLALPIAERARRDFEEELEKLRAG